MRKEWFCFKRLPSSPLNVSKKKNEPYGSFFFFTFWERGRSVMSELAGRANGARKIIPATSPKCMNEKGFCKLVCYD